jgi:hypothetical protein
VVIFGVTVLSGLHAQHHGANRLMVVYTAVELVSCQANLLGAMQVDTNLVIVSQHQRNQHTSALVPD